MSSKWIRRSSVAAALLAVGLFAAARAADQPGKGVVQNAPRWVPGELVIGFDGVPSAEAVTQLKLSLPEVKGWRKLRHAPHYKGKPLRPHPLSKVRVATGIEHADLAALGASIARHPGVAYAEPNYIVHIALEPNDPRYSSQYGPQIIEAEAGWDITMGNASVIVAIADTGLNFDHEDFQEGTVWENDDPVDGKDNDGNGFVDDYHGWDFIGGDNEPIDRNGHGSHVAGIAGARLNNGIGIAGLANVTIMPLQVFNSGGGGTWTAIEEAVYYATDNGAALLNYSGGGSGGSSGLRDAVAYAYANGMSVIAAAGNSNRSNPFYPASYDTVIAVSGTDRNDLRYSSSNFGDWIDVAAPGVDVFSCWWNGPTSYNSITGTSMSSPHVAGLAALMYSLNPDLTPDDIRQFLRDNADDLGDPGFDIYFGWGRINARRTLEDVVNSSSVILLPEDLQVIRGRIASGELSDVYGSDDERLVVQPGITLDPDEPPVWLILTGSSPTDAPGELRFILETQVDTPGVTQTIWLYNYDTGEFEEIDSRLTTLIDTVVEVVVDGDPSRFFDPETLEIQAQLTWHPPPLVLLYPWNVGIDQAVWRIAP